MNGIVAELGELIELQRYAQNVVYHRRLNTSRSGGHSSKIRGRGMDFAEVRNYQAGDEIRHMDWLITARTGRPHVKLYEEEKERKVVILTDFNPSMFFGTRVAFKSVIAARLASLIAWTVSKQGDRIGGLIFSALSHHEFVPRGRNLGVLPMLSALSKYTEELQRDQANMTGRSLESALIRLRRVAKPGNILVLISDFYNLDKESHIHLSRLRAHNDVLMYHVCDPLELAPPKPQQYAMTNTEEDLLLNTRLKSVRQAYQRFCDERLGSLTDLCNQLRIQYTQVSSEMDLPLLVRQTFPRRVS